IPSGSLLAGEKLPGLRASAWFDEQVRETWLEDSVRVVVNVAGDFDSARPTSLIIYATPNGNLIEQTLGCRRTPDIDWHYDIQHIAAQIRQWRRLHPDCNLVLACVEAEGLSWPAWRKRHADAEARIAHAVAT